ncbi:MAG TPA: TasA family protein [Patescibacteria group bacterium]|nr:TasA family protein [Patescibacteria group bacterium]
MKKLLKFTTILLGAVSLLAGATFASFVDQESTSDNTFTSGTLNLKLNGQDGILSPIMTVGNLKPGDTNSSSPFLLNLTNAGTVDGSVLLTLFSTVQDFEGQIPESETDTVGTPGKRLSDKLLITIKDQSDVVVYGPQPIRCLNDNAGGAITCNMPGPTPFVNLGTLPAGQTKTFKLVYDLPVGTNNDVQGDITTFSISSTLQQ